MKGPGSGVPGHRGSRRSVCSVLRRWLGWAVLALSWSGLPAAAAGAPPDRSEARLFAAHALALRTGGLRGDPTTMDILAAMRASGSAKAARALWPPFFENAIVKLGRLRSPTPVALYYNPLLDVALITFWRRGPGRYSIESIRALPGERLAKPGVRVARQPGWLSSGDPISELMSITDARLSAFRRAHPASGSATSEDQASFASATEDLRQALPRLVWLLASRTRWADDTHRWLFSALTRIDGILAAGDVQALSAASPLTDLETATALAELPAGFAERLTLDMMLEVGGPDRLLVVSSFDDGHIYVLVLCRFHGDACALRRFVLLSLSG